jgi:glycerol-3-phosphate dehydrogenase
VHGGLRYLQYGNSGLTALALRERDRLLAVYPQLTQRLRFFFAVCAAGHR